MRTLIFRATFIISMSLLFSWGLTIKPESIRTAEGYMISKLNVRVPSRQMEAGVLSSLRYLERGKDLNYVNLIRDIGSIMQQGWVQDVNLFWRIGSVDRTVDLDLQVLPNPAIEHLEILNTSVISSDELASLIRQKKGDILDYRLISGDISLIEKKYASKGYTLARVLDAVFIKSTRTLVYSLDEGKIHEIRVEGLENINPNLVYRLIYLKPGEVLNITKLSEARERIQATGYFSQVSMPRVQASSVVGQVDVIYSLEERKINNLQLGLEQLQNNRLSLALTLKLPNFRNTGEGLFLKGQSILDSGFKDYSYYIKYTDPWFLNQPVPFAALAYHQVNQEVVNTASAQYIRRRGWETNWDFDLGNRFHYIVAYKSEAVNDLAQRYTDYHKNSLRHILLNQSNMDLNNPLSGQRLLAEVERGGNIFGVQVGGVEYTRQSIDYSWFWNVYRQDVLAFHLGSGSVFFANSGQTIFEQDRFSLGGGYSLRGYPDAYSGIPGSMVGNKKIILNTEYRMLLADWLQLVLFVDGGLASDLDLDFSRIKWGRGAGVRFFTPIAPVRLDFALGSSNEFMLHFALGQLF